jgi:hypothetical protein
MTTKLELLCRALKMIVEGESTINQAICQQVEKVLRRRICRRCGWIMGRTNKSGKCRTPSCRRTFDANKRALFGRIPQHKRYGHLAPGWLGGRVVTCRVPECHRSVGWKLPAEIERNGRGFYCSVHRHFGSLEIIND